LKFQVRRTKQISEQLGENAVPAGFLSIPIKTYMKSVYGDDIGRGDGCKYVDKVVKYRDARDSSFSDVLYTRNELAHIFSRTFKKFNYTEEQFRIMPF
jgi:hypothetical protein